MFTRVPVTLGDTIAALAQADTTEQTRAQAAEAAIQAALTFESESRSTNVVEIQGSLAYLDNRANTLSEQHVYTNGRIDAEVSRATANPYLGTAEQYRCCRVEQFGRARDRLPTKWYGARHFSRRL